MALSLQPLSNHGYAVYPNLLQGVEVIRPNQVWVADITYIRILSGFLYLAVVLDLFFRKVIGWVLSDRIDAELSVQALRMALEERESVRDCIHHSDRVVQYACHAYVEELRAAGGCVSAWRARVTPTTTRQRGESFMKTLKCEEVYLWDYQTVKDVKERIPIFWKRSITTSGCTPLWGTVRRMSLKKRGRGGSQISIRNAMVVYRAIVKAVFDGNRNLQ